MKILSSIVMLAFLAGCTAVHVRPVPAGERIRHVCIEQNPATEALRGKYKCVSAVRPGSAIQAQCNQQRLDAFDDFDWEAIFPGITKPDR